MCIRQLLLHFIVIIFAIGKTWRKLKYTDIRISSTHRPATSRGREVTEHVEGLHIIRPDLVDTGHVEPLYLDLVAVCRIPLRAIHPPTPALR